MGVFLLDNPPSTSQVASVNMISYSSYVTLDKGKPITDLTSLIHFEETYQAIHPTSDLTINDHLLVASDPYRPSKYSKYSISLQQDKDMSEVEALSSNMV